MAETEPRSFKPGDLILFTMGDYSSYMVVALMRVIAPLSHEALTAAITDTDHAAEALLIRAGLVVEVEFHEAHASDGFLSTAKVTIEKGGVL